MSKDVINILISLTTTTKKYFLILTLILICPCITTHAQNNNSRQDPLPKIANANKATDLETSPPNNVTTNPALPREAQSESNYLTSREFIIAILIALVSLTALYMQYLLLNKIPKLKAEDSLKTFGVVLVITGTLLIISAGYSSIQIAPAMGLFGTIAGYLLGKIEKKEDEKND